MRVWAGGASGEALNNLLLPQQWAQGGWDDPGLHLLQIFNEMYGNYRQERRVGASQRGT